jgi:N utilization substance protein A
VGKLAEAGIGTVEKLGSMTPEQLEEIPGIGPKMVERIQIAVNGYYQQFEAALEEASGEGAPAAAAETPAVVPEGSPSGETLSAEAAETAPEAAPPEGPAELPPEGDSSEPSIESDRIREAD